MHPVRKALADVRNFINMGWRPASCLCFVGALFVNGIWLPVVTLTPANMVALGALITSIVAAFAVREVGKHIGSSQ